MPVHELDAADTRTVGGFKAFKNTDPATPWQETDANSVWRGLMSLVRQESISADLIVANGAADEAAGWVNLAKAFRRAANHPILATLTMTSDGQTFDVPVDSFAFNIVESGGPFPGGALYPDTATPARNNRRTILIINGSASPKAIGDSAFQQMVTLQPGEACQFTGQDDGSGGTIWMPVGKDLDHSAFGIHSYSVKLYNYAAHAETSATFQMSYIRHSNNRLVTVDSQLTTITMTTGGTGSIILADTPFGALSHGTLPDVLSLNPDFLPASTQNPIFLVAGQIGSTWTTFALQFDANQILITRTDGANYAGGEVVTLFPFCITYYAKP